MPHDGGAPDALDRTAMVTTRSVMAEVVRALAVLALVFLSFAHQPAVAATGDGYAAPSGYDFCGSPPDDLAHAPCHACRANPAVLPRAPAVAEPAFVAVDVAPNNPIQRQIASPFERTPANPRAPPALV